MTTRPVARRPAAPPPAPPAVPTPPDVAQSDAAQSAVAQPASALSAAGRAEAFSALYRSAYPRVVAFARRRLGDRELAEDIAAETFRIAWEKSAEAVVGEPWLFVTARNLILNQNRSTVRSAELARKAAADPDRPLTAPGPSLPDTTDADRVRAAMDNLTSDQRELLTAFYWDELDGAACAALFGCSQGALWVRLHRARQALKLALGEAVAP